MLIFVNPSLSFCKKITLSEYGSGWEWDNKMPRVFDYTQTGIDIPMRYSNSVSTTTPTVNGTWVNYGSASSSEVKYPFCPTETTDGQILFSGSLLNNSISCESHAFNAGNYYNLPSQLGDAKYNNVCPRGWTLPDSNGKTNYSNFLIIYGIDYNASSRTNQDSALLNLPLSFLRSGLYYYNGSLYDQGSLGHYRMMSLSLYLNSGSLSPIYNADANYGYSVRCVSE